MNYETIALLMFASMMLLLLTGQRFFGVICFALTIPLSAILAERSRRGTLLGVSAAIALFGLVMAPAAAAIAPS